MAEMKSLNGNTFVDQSARNEIEALKKNGVGGGGGDVSTGAMQAAIAAAIQEHNEKIQVHPNRIDPMAAELVTIKQTVSELTAAKVGADPAGTAATKVSEHDTYTGSHNDIRLLIQGLSDRLNALANSDDTTLDDLKEIVTYIKANKSLIDSITTSKVSVTDIIDNLTTNVSNRPLSAAQGVALKNLIDALGNSKLDASALGAAVNQALLIAKESGEFKGEKGDKGDQGIQGERGATGTQGPKGDPYTLTETDKALIVAQVIESLGGNPIFGYVDEDNNIIVQGNLGDGTYSVKYEMEDGSTVDIGNLVLDTNVYYSITKNLTNCVLDNSATQVVAGGSYSATVTANSGYTLDSVSVTMGGSAVSVSGGVVSIASVTGDIVITAVASEAQTDNDDNILTNGAYTVELNKRWSASSKTYNTCNGMICLTVPTVDVLNKTVYFKGFTKDLQASSQPPLWMCFDTNLAKLGAVSGGNGNGAIWTATGLQDEGSGVYSFIINDTNFKEVSSSATLKLNMAVNESAAVTSLDGLIMTIDKPIS